MGYYTRYEFEVFQDGNKEIDYVSKLRRFSEQAEHAIDENGDCKSETEWYYHEIQLKSFSKFYPDVVFRLMGEGEHSADLWMKYFKDGKMQKEYARITYNPYDEKELR